MVQTIETSLLIACGALRCWMTPFATKGQRSLQKSAATGWKAFFRIRWKILTGLSTIQTVNRGSKGSLPRSTLGDVAEQVGPTCIH